METLTKQQEECAHPDRELLGWDHSLAFGRCVACGRILLKQQGTLWSLRPSGSVVAEPPAANDDAERAAAANDNA